MYDHVAISVGSFCKKGNYEAWILFDSNAIVVIWMRGG